MKSKFKTIFFVLLLTLLSLLFMNTSVFAADSKTVDGVTYSCTSRWLPSGFFNNFNYFCFLSSSNGSNSKLFCADKKFNLDYSSAYFDESPSYFVIFSINDYTFNEETSTYEWGTDSRSICENGNLENTKLEYNVTDQISENYFFVSGNAVFYQPPQVVLTPIMKEAPLVEVMKEILEILPIVLMTIVGLISLRKGLQLLSTVLHHS